MRLVKWPAIYPDTDFVIIDPPPPKKKKVVFGVFSPPLPAPPPDAPNSFRGLSTSTKGPICWHDGGDGVESTRSAFIGGMDIPLIRKFACAMPKGVLGP